MFWPYPGRGHGARGRHPLMSPDTGSITSTPNPQPPTHPPNPTAHLLAQGQSSQPAHGRAGCRVRGAAPRRPLLPRPPLRAAGRGGAGIHRPGGGRAVQLASNPKTLHPVRTVVGVQPGGAWRRWRRRRAAGRAGLHGHDWRRHGRGNIGNVNEQCGWRAGGRRRWRRRWGWGCGGVGGWRRGGGEAGGRGPVVCGAGGCCGVERHDAAAVPAAAIAGSRQC